MKAAVPNSFRIRDTTSLVGGELRNGTGLLFTFLENGTPFAITHGDILINQVLGSPIDGAVGNIYIRLHDEAISYFPLMGPAAESRFRVGERGASWHGVNQGIAYQCDLRLAPDEPIWFWTVHLRNTTGEPRLVDVVHAQDLGIAAPGVVRTNELYTSQYIDYTAYQAGEYGWVVCSRQNQPQDNSFPWILHGCFEGAAGYLTDGFQFFGLSYKETNVPAALTRRQFPNATYQYEFGLPALKTHASMLAAGEAIDVTFFAVYQPDHPEASSERDLEKIEVAAAIHHSTQNADVDTSGRALPNIGDVFSAAPLFEAQTLTAEELDRYFSGERRHVERQDGDILSFFYGDDYHVVMKRKELLTERPHGTILRSGSQLTPDDETLSLTAWMYGVFNSHLAIGNTNFNKFLTISRNPLNILKSSGQRIFVKTAAGYALLSMPSAFEMGLSSARWIYKGSNATIVVRLWTAMHDPACFLEITVEGPDELEFLISNNLVLGDLEYETGGLVEIDEATKRVEALPSPQELMAQRYPAAGFSIVPTHSDDMEVVGGDELLFSDGVRRKYPYVAFKTRPVRCTRLLLTGQVLSREAASIPAERYTDWTYGYDTLQQESETFWRGVRRNADIRIEGQPEIARLNDIVRWYSHNALVHLTTPYGLEQYSGAAWGTRDVCQGPVEFLLAFRHFDAIKAVLRTVYAHQIHETGDWPQWFMFDRYWDIYAPDSHADIVVWPMKAVCDYVEATNDLGILDEQIAFTSDKTKTVTAWTTPLFDHTVRQVERMEGECLPGTTLIGYGHGDWEDTLQPADPAVRKRWVSPWTVELMYQTLGRYATVCERAGRVEMSNRLRSLCARIREDFNRYLLKGGVVGGLVEFGPEGTEYLLHPDDSRTGVHYRLLPMTRGMISGIFSPEQARDHLALIDEHLMFPDGARLMDRPIPYHGGTEGLFKRAETAANFGREIGLQYVHAHIRYVEAMARLGRPEDVYRGLMMIIPIGIQHVVPSALPRQSNSYFSSSDAAFRDRYEASLHFDRVKTSEVGIKGGWRIYSSGPGMVIAALVLNILGLREYFSDVLFDPVLPRRLDGLAFDFEYAGKAVRYLYHITGDGFSPRRVAVNGVALKETRYAENPYRRGGMLVPKQQLIGAFSDDENLVEIYL